MGKICVGRKNQDTTCSLFSLKKNNAVYSSDYPEPDQPTSYDVSASSREVWDGDEDF